MTRQIKIGNVSIGGGAPIRVESMLKVALSQKEECVEQCERLLREGCELARVALPSVGLAEFLAWLNERTSLPLMAAIQFDPELAVAAIKAGCAGIRINPGNMPLRNLTGMIRMAKERQAVIRIGANGGSLSARQLAEAEGDRAVALFLAVKEQADLLLEHNFHDIILSAKSSSVGDTARANAFIARAYPHLPLHIGVTEAGPGDGGIVKSTVGIASLLEQGIGDTLRVSLTDEPEREVRVGYEILKALGLRARGVNLISCPTCGRTEIDLMGMTARVEEHLQNCAAPRKVAVMGCAVNGPGEAREADIGLAGGRNRGVIFRKGRIVRAARGQGALLACLLEELDAAGREYPKHSQP